MLNARTVHRHLSNKTNGHLPNLSRFLILGGEFFAREGNMNANIVCKILTKDVRKLKADYFFFADALFFKTNIPVLVSETILPSGTAANGVPFLCVGSLAKK